MSIKLWLGVACSALIVASSLACGGLPAPWWTRAPPASVAPVPSIPSAPSSSMWILSDSQLHDAAGAGTWSKSDGAEGLSPTAVRPPSLDLWSDVVLADIVKTIAADARSPTAPVFFLGDAADVSCVGELSRFLDIMKPLPWLGVPGNHDGYYMGNGTFRPDAVIRAKEGTWQGACQHNLPSKTRALERLERHFLEDLDGKGGLTHVKQGTLTKTHAIWMYLLDLAPKLRVMEGPEDFRSWKLSEDKRWLRYSLEGTYALSGVEMRVSAQALLPNLDEAERKHEKSRAWQAALVQDVTLSNGVHVLLIDTSDYARTPPTSYRQVSALLEAHSAPSCGTLSSQMLIPGECGEIGPRQVKAIEDFMSTWPADTRFFVMGHHPWEDFSGSSQLALHFLREAPGFLAYVSAHTHSPTAPRTFDAPEAWELNIGSTTDWPMEYVSLHYWPPDATGPGTPLLVDVRHAESTETCPYASLVRARREVDYGNVERYTSVALAAYDAMLTALTPFAGSRIATLQHLVSEIRAARQRCGQLRRTLDGVSIREDMQRFEVESSLETCVQDQRELLARLIAYDRTVLHTLPRAREMEAACAIWASAVECAKNDCRGGKTRSFDNANLRSFFFRARTDFFATSPEPRPGATADSAPAPAAPAPASDSP
jgi:hypothetical protein